MSFRGLTSNEVAGRVTGGQSNAWQPRVGRSYLDILRDNLFNVFNLVLFPLLGVIVHFREYAVAIFAGFSVISNAVLGTAQEMVAKRRLDRLVALSERKVRVYRDGALTEVGIRELVRDDVIPLQPGERLVVDGRVLASDALELNESQLTGEADSVLKEVDAPVYSGSWCIAGTGVMLATAVGAESMINRIAQSAKSWKQPLTPTQRKVMVIVDIAILLMLILAPMLWLAGSLTGLSLLERVKESVVFITSLVPYGLLLVMMISLSIGALSISRHQTLIRRVNAVESLANATVLCFDKTGTITENRLAVADILPLNGASPEEIRRQLHCYTANLAHHNGTAAAVAEHLRAALPAAEPEAEKLREIPFSSGRQWGAVILPGETLILGAPERVLNGAQQELRQRAQMLSAQGLRVLTFARSATPPQDDQLAEDAEPLALVTLSDRIRPDIHETLQAFREQGVGLKVISGDNMETVRAIAAAAGMETEPAWTGPQLEAMSAPELTAAAQQGAIFARVAPDTKRRIVQALQQDGHVAMVGDGVNDVPALKAADLAIVMNDGARIAREIGDILLLNNAMSTLPTRLRRGPRNHADHLRHGAPLPDQDLLQRAALRLPGLHGLALRHHAHSDQLGHLRHGQHHRDAGGAQGAAASLHGQLPRRRAGLRGHGRLHRLGHDGAALRGDLARQRPRRGCGAQRAGHLRDLLRYCHFLEYLRHRLCAAAHAVAATQGHLHRPRLPVAGDCRLLRAARALRVRAPGRGHHRVDRVDPAADHRATQRGHAPARPAAPAVVVV